jgi:N-sulfoglucosamine sulfohydrolase
VIIPVRTITSFNRVPSGPRESSTTRIRGLTGVRPVAVAAVVLCCLLSGMPYSAAAERPNILLIVSEDNGPELGSYGEPFVKTPVLDKLAADGVRFHNAYVPQAGCSQSRAALLTGLYPHQNGQIGLATWKFRMYRQDTPNVVRSLKSVGYRTGIIGKLHINPAAAFPFDMHRISSANFGRKKLGDYAKHAEEFMNADDESFFLSVNYPDAHRPFTRQTRGLPESPLTGDDVTPLAYFGLDTPQLRHDTADYYNCMSRLDSLVGDLLAALQRSGKADNTLVVYLGDHGADLLRGKRTSYEGGVRIPLIVRWPGNTTSNLVRQELVSTLDLMPTLLKVAKAEPVADLSGKSLLPLLNRHPPDTARSEWRRYLFTEYHLHSAHNFYPQRTVRDERYKLIQNLMPGKINPGYGFTLNRFFAELPVAIESAPDHIRASYHRMQTPPAFELYDLQDDPHEFRDLAANADHSDVLAELKKQLVTWRKQTNDPLLVPGHLQRLKAEVDACIVDGAAEKQRLTLTYPDYFFAPRAQVPHKLMKP